MDLPTTITVHDSQSESTAMWNKLIAEGGYSIRMDVQGNLHAMKFNPGWVAAS